MTTTALTPNGVILNSNYTPTGGTADAVLADSNDGTYDANLGGAGGFGAWLTLALTTTTIPAGSYVASLYVDLRHALPTGPTSLRYIDTKLYAPQGGFGSLLTLDGSRIVAYGNVPTDYLSIGFGASFDGVMNQSQLDGMQLVIRDLGDPTLIGIESRVYKATVNVVTNVLPTSSGGSIGIGPGTQPTVTWTTTNSDTVKCSYQLRVFTAAQAADVLFDPNQTTPVWDSGVVLTTSITPSGKIGINLTPGTQYVICLKLGAVTGWTKNANEIGGAPPSYVTNDVWYQSGTLVISPIAPARPYMVLTDQPNNVTGGPRVQIDLTSQDNELSLGQYSMLNAINLANAGQWFGFDANTTPVKAAAGAPLLGTNVIQVTRNTSTGDAVVNSHYGGATVNGVVSQQLLPVVAGHTYAAFAQVKSAATSRTSVVMVDWFDSTGTFLSTTSFTGVATSTSAWKFSGGSVAAPANSAFARMSVKFQSAIATEVHYFHVPVFRPLDNGDTISTDGVIHPAGAGFRATGNKLNAFDADSETITGSSGGGSVYKNCNGINSTAATARTGSRTLRQAAPLAQASIFRKNYQTPGSGGDYPYPLAPNATTIYVSGYAKHVTVNSVLAFVGIQWFSSTTLVPAGLTGSSFISQQLSASVSTNTSTYTQVNGTFTVPPGAVSYLPMWGYVATGTTQNMDWDDLQVSDVASPYSFGGINDVAYGTAPYSDNDQYARCFMVEKSADGGVTWRTVRGASKVPLTGVSEPQTLTVWDYEIMAGVAYQYRASTFGYYQDYEFAQPTYYTANVTPALTTSGTNPRRWWLKDPLDPTKSMQVDILEDALVYDEAEAQTQYEPLGHNRYLIIADVVYGKLFTVTFDFIDPTEYANFKTLRNSQRVLLLQRQWNGDQWYVRLGPSVKVSEENTTPVRYLVDTTAIEVDVLAV